MAFSGASLAIEGRACRGHSTLELEGELRYSFWKTRISKIGSIFAMNFHLFGVLWREEMRQPSSCVLVFPLIQAQMSERFMQ